MVQDWNRNLYLVEKKVGSYQQFSCYGEGGQNSGKCWLVLHYNLDGSRRVGVSGGPC